MIYFLAAILLATTALVFGVAAPMLISAPSWIAVVLGLVLIALYFPFAVWIIRRITARVRNQTTSTTNLSDILKRTAPILLLALTAFGTSACSKVPAGQVGVRVNLYGDDKGVQNEVLGPGRYWVGWNQDLYLFPTFTQTHTWTADTTDDSPANESITFQDKQGLTINADVGVSFHIEPTQVSSVFQKYRAGIDEINHKFLHNLVRDAFVECASNMDVADIIGIKKPELLDKVITRVRKEVGGIGINIEYIAVVGEMRLPQIVMESINGKIEATQKAQQRQNEVAEATAAANKRIEEAKGNAESIRLNAIAQADANKIINASLTPTLVQYMATQKWDGQLPKFTGSAAIPFLNVEAADK